MHDKTLRLKLIIVALSCISIVLMSAMLYVFWWSFLIGYDMFGTYLFVANINQINEFWFEFIALHIIFISIFILIRKADLMEKRY